MRLNCTQWGSISAEKITCRYEPIRFVPPGHRYGSGESTGIVGDGSRIAQGYAKQGSWAREQIRRAKLDLGIDWGL